jgi:hypothetical protein
MNPEAAWAIGDFLQLLLTPFDWVGMWGMLNMFVVIAGFVGLIYWLRVQSKMIKKAKDEGTLV